MLSICFGPNTHILKIRRELICDRVPYIDQLVNGTSTASPQTNVCCHDDDVQVWNVILSWVYNDQVQITWLFHGESTYEQYEQKHLLGLRVYVLASRLEIPEIMEETIDQTFFEKEGIHLIYVFDLAAYAEMYRTTTLQCSWRRITGRFLAFALQYNSTLHADKAANIINAYAEAMADCTGAIRMHVRLSREEMKNDIVKQWRITRGTE